MFLIILLCILIVLPLALLLALSIGNKIDTPVQHDKRFEYIDRQQAPLSYIKTCNHKCPDCKYRCAYGDEYYLHRNQPDTPTTTQPPHKNNDSVVIATGSDKDGTYHIHYNDDGSISSITRSPF